MGSSSRSSPGGHRAFGSREVLDKGQADLSILFTTDARAAQPVGQVHLPRGRQELLPAGNVLFVARTETADEAGPDFGETIESVQSNPRLPR